jgi:RNA polymerase sigma-70 factor (ECF subfamily)
VEERALDSRQALDGFLASVERRAFRMAEIATGNREDALDIVQDAMLKLAQSYAHKPADQWGALFHRILQHRIRDWYRRNKVRSHWRVWLTGRADSQDGHVDPLQHQVDEHAVLPERQLETWNATEALDNEIRLLPQRQQQVLMLRLWEGLDVEQTAAVLGISGGSVKSHYSRAVHSLRQKLGEHWP